MLLHESLPAGLSAAVSYIATLKRRRLPNTEWSAVGLPDYSLFTPPLPTVLFWLTPPPIKFGPRRTRLLTRWHRPVPTHWFLSLFDQKHLHESCVFYRQESNSNRDLDAIQLTGTNLQLYRQCTLCTWRYTVHLKIYCTVQCSVYKIHLTFVYCTVYSKYSRSDFYLHWHSSRVRNLACHFDRLI